MDIDDRKNYQHIFSFTVFVHQIWYLKSRNLCQTFRKGCYATDIQHASLFYSSIWVQHSTLLTMKSCLPELVPLLELADNHWIGFILSWMGKVMVAIGTDKQLRISPVTFVFPCGSVLVTLFCTRKCRQFNRMFGIMSIRMSLIVDSIAH